jgi:ABC-type nitrate/sulfonate/bicarbonate transport system substrate-binding protein
MGKASRLVLIAAASVLVVASLALGLAGCDRGNGEPSLPSVVVGYRDLGTALPALHASESGPLGKVDHRLAVRRYATESALRKALVSGEITLAILPVVTAADLYLDRVPITIVGATAESFGRDGIVTTTSMDSLDEIVGRTVVTPGPTGSFFVWAMLESAGLDPMAVTLEEQPYARAMRALDGGEYQAAQLSGAALAQAGRASDRKVQVTTKDFPGLLIDVLVVGRPYAERRPDVVQAVMRAIGESGGQVAADPATTDNLVALAASTTPAKVAAARGGLRYLDLVQNIELMGVVGSPGALPDTAAMALQFATERTGAQTPPDPGKLTDSRFVNPASN